MVGSLHIKSFREFRKVLVVRLSSLGDIIHTLPAVHQLRRALPKAQIHWVVKKKHHDLLQGNPLLDEVIPVDTDGWKGDPVSKETFSQVKGLAGRLQWEKYDLVVDFQGSIKSGLISYLTHSPFRLGFSPSCCREPLSALFTNEWVTLRRGKYHKVEMYGDLLKGIGIEFPGLPAVCVRPPSDGGGIDNFLEREVGNHKPRVAINPGARWETKRWPLEYWSRLADFLQAQGAKVIIVWGPGEREMASEVGALMSFFPIIAPLTNLKQLLFLLSRVDLVIAGDTGPLHLAAAMGTPVIGLYGPTDPLLNGPYGQMERVIETDLSCRGCWKRVCTEGTCMRSISPEKVYRLAIRFLNS